MHERDSFTTPSNQQVASLTGATNRDTKTYPLTFGYFTLEDFKGVRLCLSERGEDLSWLIE